MVRRLLAVVFGMSLVLTSVTGPPAQASVECQGGCTAVGLVSGHEEDAADPWFHVSGTVAVVTDHTTDPTGIASATFSFNMFLQLWPDVIPGFVRGNGGVLFDASGEWVASRKVQVFGTPQALVLTGPSIQMTLVTVDGSSWSGSLTLGPA